MFLFSGYNHFMKLIIGLGNPGAQYLKTRHNAGFLVVEGFAAKHGLVFSNTKFDGVFAKGDGFVVAKPNTFMNLSGSFVQALMHFYKVTPENIIVVVDDTSFDVGQISLKPSGSSAGHNGLKDIISKLGTSNFARLKIGIGQPTIDLAAYVLANFKSDDLPALKAATDRAISVLEIYLRDGLEKAMVKANTKVTSQ